MTTSRQKIPASIKRAVRQRCSYGCILCGMPIFEYDHMQEYAKVHRHEAENITLLCPNHHADKTAGRLPLEKVRKANASPHNRGLSLTSGYILHSAMGSAYRVRLGTSFIANDLFFGESEMSALAVDDGVVLGAQVVDGELLLRANLRDIANRPVVKIVDNEVVVSTSAWDVEWISNRLKIWDVERAVGVEIHFLRDGLSIPRGMFWANGLPIKIINGVLHVGEVTFEHSEIIGAGIYVGNERHRPRRYAIHVSGAAARRFNEGVIPPCFGGPTEHSR